MKLQLDQLPYAVTLEGRRWILSIYLGWLQFLNPKHWNWINVELIHVGFEWDRSLPGFEVTCCLLGFGFHIRINGDWSTTELGRELMDLDRERIQ